MNSDSNPIPDSSVAKSGPERPLRLAVLGMIPGNGHPYSWSAIVNGFDAAAMADCPFPVIPRYLGEQPEGSVLIPGATVTHLWTDNPKEAPLVAKAALIANIVARPEDVIGQVDAVLVAVDDGFDHVRRTRPFVEAGLPVFVDKPLATSIADLRTFIEWERAGARVLSSTGLRYSPQLEALIRDEIPKLGDLRWLYGTTCNTWERYGIHLLEPLYCITGPGFESIRLESRPGLEIAHLVHKGGAQISIPVIRDGNATFGSLRLHGTHGQAGLRFSTTYQNFRRQLLSFIAFARSGVRPYPFAETVELMSVLIAGIRSREENSRRVEIVEIIQALSS